ncbi:retrovirus-related Pol polyprotein from transposon TNT 1-94 [Trifolium pratense]|uniref:Retrovirus-related Pol polyprotein from transposon TNT 1-94 n=1 Tax=Trifolium pratense TaxID=57577 RepID=A0A2K3MYC6_TRIPR|nr:retrovirus-related Pol polyprotein from transposon TNT 1-94 [Trifolium pratense]
MNSVISTISQSLVYIESASQAWNDLKARFSRADRVRISSLQRELYALRQESSSVTEFFTKLKGLWEELELYRPIPTCTCTFRCVCEAMINAKKFKEEDLVLLFLTGLTDNYAMVRSQILLMEPFPQLNAVFGLVIQHESLNGLDVVEDSSPTVSINLAKKPYCNAKSSGKSDKMCTYCHKNNHIVDNCFKKHGFPPGYRFRDGTIAGSKSQSQASSNCIEAEETVNKRITEQDNRVVASFSHEEFQALKALLKSNSRPVGEGTSSQIHSFSRNIASSSSNDKQGMNSSQSNTWILDSGATDHVCNSLQLFINHRQIPSLLVKLPNGNYISTTMVGDIKVTAQITLHDVLFIPNFHYNLISISKIAQDLDCNFVFTDNVCLIQTKLQKMIGSGKLIDGLYYLEGTCFTQSSEKFGKSCNSVAIPKSALWHFRFGHTSQHRLEQMQQMYPTITINKDDFCCDVCHLAKQKKLPYTLSNSRATHCLELLHMDIWGPFSTPTPHGHRYFLTIVDDFSRFTWIVLLKGKFETASKIKDFINLVENQFGSKVKILRSDNGPEFLSLTTFYASKGILHQTSCVATPQQNGRVERKHQCILNIARALLLQSHLPPAYWGYAVFHAVFIMNRVPSSAIKGRIPFDVLYGKLPELSQLIVFGSLCYVSSEDTHKSKFDNRARKCVFLGYRPGMKGYVALDLHNHAIITSRHVIFEETVLPYPVNTTTPSWELHSPSNSSSPLSTSPIELTNDHETTNQTSNDQIPSPSTEPFIDNTPVISDHDIVDSPITPSSPPLRKSTRLKKPPSRLMDYNCNAVTHKTPYPITNFISHSHLSPTYSSYCLSLLTDQEPNSYAEASQSEWWVKAMQSELNALANNHTWKIVDLPAGVKPIGSKWVYKIKRKADGSIDRYKARLVAKGYNQIEGIDYFETFSPVAKMTTIRTVLAIASIQRWHVHQLDVDNAFLHGDLDEDVYMKIPQGLEGIQPNKTCKLIKSLYGLKQASRQWYAKLSHFLTTIGYTQMPSDPTLFTKSNQSEFTSLLVYVDDIVLAGNCLAEIQVTKSKLHEAFGIKDIGVLKFFLGLEVAHSEQGITLCQRKYCLDLLNETGNLGCKPSSIPMDPSHRPHHDDSTPHENITEYRALVGKLLYLTSTRPDIAFPVQQLSQFLDAPTSLHFKAAHKVLRYLKGNPGTGLFFPRNSSLQLSGFSDADWGGCPDSRRSITGYCFFIGQSLVCWKSKKQLTVSKSSSEAEYRALASTTCELQWLTYLLRDLQIHTDKLSTLYCDSQSALHIASNPVFHERTKHIDIDCHIVREKLQGGLMKLLPITGYNQIADIFTKALHPANFHRLFAKLGLLNIFQASA